MTGIVDLGETFSSDMFEVRDSAGALANAGTVTATITLPDGTTTSPAVANPAIGKYTFDYLTVQAGLHRYLVHATGGVLGSLVRRWSDSFDVTDAVPLISVREALAHLRATGVITGSADLEQLRVLCLVATSSVERDLNRVLVRRTLTKQWTVGPQPVSLRMPVASITSVTIDGGAAIDATGYRVDEHGLLWSRYGWGSGYWPGMATVTYVAGDASPDPVARQAAKNLIQSMWQASQQAPHPFVDESSAEAFAATALPGLSQIPGYDSLRIPAMA